MRGKLLVLVVALAAVGIWQVGGCANVIPQQTVPFNLGSGGVFDVEAGVESEKTFTSDSFDTGGITLGSGSLKINPDAVTVTPAGAAGKGAQNLQANQSLFITAWIDDLENVDTVCGSEDVYGPYEVVLDAGYNVVSITPDSITFSQNTLDLFNLGRFSLCIRVESPVTGQVEIEALTFSLGL